MNKQPLFSIIIPVYNVQDYLAQCLDSVLNQTFQHYEIILIDDGSSDDSSQICTQYALQHSKITWLKQPNQGVSVARNRGIELAHGEYIMFLDSDDYWRDQNALNNLAQIITNQPTTDLIIYPLTVEFFNHQQQIQSFYYNTQDLTHDFKKDFFKLIQKEIFNSTACNKLIRRQLLMTPNIRFPENKRYEDVAFYFELAPHIQHYYIHNHPFYHYRFKRAGSSSFQPDIHHVLDYLEILASQIDPIQYFHQQQNPLWLGLFEYWRSNLDNIASYYAKLPHAQKHILTRSILTCIQFSNQFRLEFEKQNQT